MAPRKSRPTRFVLVDWEEAGERWELPKRGVYPIWQMIHPNVQMEIQATPIGEMFPKIQLAMASKSDKYDVIDDDYAFFPQLIAGGHLTLLQDRLDADEAYKADIYGDVPENILDLYRDKPLKDGGQLYGLPPGRQLPTDGLPQGRVRAGGDHDVAGDLARRRSKSPRS